MHETQRLLSNTWPALVSIKVRCVRVDPDTLLNFFARHKDTLTTLSLHRVGFEPNTPHTWLDNAQRAGQPLHLDYTELDVYEWGDDFDISGLQVNCTGTDLVRTFRNYSSQVLSKIRVAGQHTGARPSSYSWTCLVHHISYLE